MTKTYRNATYYIFICLIFITSQSKAFVCFQEDRSIEHKQLENQKQKADSLFGIHKIKDAVSVYQDAISNFKKDNLKNKGLLFELYADLSYCYAYDYLNNLDNQKKYLEEARLILDEKLVNPEKLVNFYLDLAIVNKEEGDYLKSLGFVNKAKTVFKTRKQDLINTKGLSSTLELQASVFESEINYLQMLEDETKLLDTYQDFKSFYDANSSKASLNSIFSQALFRIGRYYQKRDLKQAVYFFDEAERISPSMNTKIYSVICKGFSHLDFKDYQGALKVMEHLKTFENLNKFQQLNVYEIASRCHSELGQKPALIENTNKALTLLNKNNSDVDVLNFNAEEFSPITELKYPVLLNQFAMFLEDINDDTLNNTADEIFRIGLKQFADRIDHNPLNKHFVNYEIIKNRVLQQIADHEISDLEMIQFLNRIERIETKSQFNTILLNRSLAENTSDLDELFNKESNLRSELTTLKQKQQNGDSLAKQHIFDIELKITDIKNEIKSENSPIYKLTNTDFSLEDLKIPEQTTILKFTKANDELFRIYINSNTVNIESLGDYETIEKLTKKYVSQLKDHTQIETLNTLSTELYDVLLSDISISNQTVIIADAILNYLPFELLKNDNNYFIETSAISYANGLSYIDTDAYKTVNHKKNITFFAPAYSKFTATESQLAVRGEPYDLLGAKEEVTILSDLLDGTVYENENASKYEFINLPKDYAIIHLAGHAFLNDEDPELSNILFSDDKEDNQLFVSELYGLKSNADLAVLSACNTGVGGYSSGKGIVSLSQAFMYSGIPATVSSLWSAPDNSTKEIMISFYQHLKDGKSKSVALQQAKLDYLKLTSNPKLKHPYYWAGFVLYGNDAPIELTNNSWALYYWISIGFAILLLGFAIKNSRRKS
ncbi:CHAT domain-containing protein [Psychroserpens ponticola]|uniref:CHAT domain-containing protein n=1 Tax=Psychroserpens ponticola TaxID=2932268 RepID=A0ABY7RXX6_9FLAO|nr:CHAT domain-containing protein [Psychroserpens ponticola]WCO01994.1 CHAT domain-containing protein [Psychroserpens ponticola]